MNHWLFLFVAAGLEVVWALGLKYTEGFTRLWPSIGTIAAMVVSMYCLAVAARGIPIGTAYAVWTGLGAVGAAIGGMVLFGEPRDALRMAALAMIVGGVAALKMLHR
jgi:quaternary ammonium compound-resistance protein SugE